MKSNHESIERTITFFGSPSRKGLFVTNTNIRSFSANGEDFINMMGSLYRVPVLIVLPELGGMTPVNNFVISTGIVHL